jgi:hypothetical protein
MNANEIHVLIQTIRQLRHYDPDSAAARALEKETCIQMLLMLPLKSGCKEDFFLPGVSKDVARVVLCGILLSRPNDSGRLNIQLPENNSLWRSWERQAG